MSDDLKRNDIEQDNNQQEQPSMFREDRENAMKDEAYNQAIEIMNGKVKLPRIRNKEDARRVFFGRSVNYYMRYYKRYTETGKRVSWNWAAFIFNPTWFFSRKMYLYGMITTFITTIYSVGTYMLYTNINHANVNNIMLVWSLFFFVMYLGVGMFGNYLYITHMENKIVYPGEQSLNEEQLSKINIMRGGVSINGIIMAFLASNIMLILVQEMLAMMY